MKHISFLKAAVVALLLLGTVPQAHAQASPEQPLHSTWLKVGLGYGYNFTWQHHGWIDLAAYVPINQHFELEAMAQADLANVYSVALNLRPKFPLRHGELFLETRLLYKAIARNQIHDFVGGISLGYRMDYFQIQIGGAGRMMATMHQDWHSNHQLDFEPVMQYALEVFVRPQKSPWNLSFRFTNFDDWQVERFFQPLFMLNSYVTLAPNWRLLMRVECKPTGMFHLNASFYGADGTVGIAYALPNK